MATHEPPEVNYHEGTGPAWFGVALSGLAIIAILCWDWIEPLFRWPK